MILSTKEVYSYKTPVSFGSIPSSVNMDDVSFSKLMGMCSLRTADAFPIVASLPPKIASADPSGKTISVT